MNSNFSNTLEPLSPVERKMGHTPGPWRQYAQQIIDQETHNPRPVDERYRTIEAGQGYFGLKGDKALGFALSGYISVEDAQVMAAAPDMLASMEEIQSLLEFYSEREITAPANNQEAVRDTREKLGRFRAAIRRARGETAQQHDRWKAHDIQETEFAG